MTSAQRGHLAMLAFSALIAGSFSLGSMAANHISPMALTAPRFLLAAFLVALVAVPRGAITREAAAAPWRYLVMGGLYGFYFVMMFEGLKTAPPVSAAAVASLIPIIAAVVGYILLRQITTARMAGALVLGGIGAIWVIFRADWNAIAAFRIGQGEMIYFWGCVGHAIYVPVVRMLNRGERPAAFTFGTLVAGGLIVTIWGWSDLRETDWGALPMIVWGTLVYTAVFATAGTTYLVQYASLHLPAAKVMAYTYLTPSWVILWEISLGHGAPPGLVLAGVALTILALIMLLKNEH